MCGGLIFKTKGTEEIITVYFPRPYATIYGINNDYEFIKAYWGKRDESEFESIEVPKTGWAKIESLAKGYWDKYNYTNVFIPAYKYMEKDKNGHSLWFDLKEEEFIRGILIIKENINFIYVVTVPSEGDFKKIHNRWVSIVHFNGQKDIINFNQ
jgi:signal peptidase I